MSTPAASLPLAVEGRDWLTPLELGLLGAIWGASFLFMRVAAPELGAVVLVELRLALGALALAPALWVARRAFPLRRIPLIVGVGLINSAIPFLLFAWAAQRAPAGIGAITNALTVLFAALVAYIAYGERIGARRALALLVGFSGVVGLAAGRNGGGSDVTWAALAGSLAALCYGVGANVVRRKLGDLPPVALGAATLAPSALLLAPFAIAQWPQAPVSLAAWGSAAAIGLLCTGVAYGVYYRLLKRVGAPRAVTVTYLVPLFGVGWAWLVLGEQPTWSMALAGLLILGSVAFSQRVRG